MVQASRVTLSAVALSLLLCSVAAAVFPNAQPLLGDRVITVSLRDDSQKTSLTSVLESSQHVNVWKQTNSTSDVHIPAGEWSLIEGALRSHGLSFEILHEDVGELVNAQMKQNQVLQESGAGFFDSYASELQLSAYLRSIASEYSSMAELHNIGVSLEGRNITAIRICSSSDCSQLPAIVFNGCQHAREWLSPMTVTYVMTSLLANYTANQEVQDVVDGFEWWFIPVVNVDGYAYSWTDNRLWRKNRRQNPDSPCDGVDLNRNWAYSWGVADEHTSDIACAETYYGSSQFSEPEEQAVAQLIYDLGRVEWYIDFHMYGGLFMFPWSYTCDSYTEDVSIQQSMGDAYTSALKSVQGTDFVVDSSCRAMYQATGFSIDWTYAQIGSVYSYCCELSGTTFLEPASVILPTGQEHFEGVLAGAGFVLQNPRHPHS